MQNSAVAVWNYFFVGEMEQKQAIWCLKRKSLSINLLFMFMAPVLLACRLSVPSLFIITAFVLFVTLFIRDSNSALVYDRATLLNIRSIYEKQLNEAREEFQFGVRNPPISIPTWLQRDPWPPLPKRRRRRGKRGGRQVKLKAYLVSLPRVPRLADVRLRGWRGSRVLCGRLENAMLRWIRPIVPEGPAVSN